MSGRDDYELAFAAIAIFLVGAAVAVWLVRVMSGPEKLPYDGDSATESPMQYLNRRNVRVWATVVLYVLIVDTALVGALYSRTLFGRDTSPAPGVSVTAPALERLMQSGLDDLQALKALQAKTLDALKAPGGQPGTTGVAHSSGGTVSLTWPAVVGLFLVAVGGFLLLRASGPLVSVPRGLGALSLLAGLSVMKVEHLIRIDSLKFEFPTTEAAGPKRPSGDTLVVINVPPDKQPPIAVPSGSNVEIRCESDKGPLKVGSFVSGQHQTLMPGATDTVDELMSKIDGLAAEKSVVALFLMGSADQTHMNRETEQQYDSNLTLAQKRAAWVATEMKKQALLRANERIANLTSMFILGSAPRHVGPDTPEGELAKDRIVSVCLVLQQMPPTK